MPQDREIFAGSYCCDFAFHLKKKDTKLNKKVPESLTKLLHLKLFPAWAIGKNQYWKTIR